MLVLSRRLEESILIDGRIRLTVIAIRGSIVRLGIEAPPEVGITRSEIAEVKPPRDRIRRRTARPGRGVSASERV